MSTEAAKHRRWLLDIVENIDKVNAYVAGMTLREFEANAMAVDAVERCIMRITEVAFRLQGKAETWMPQQEWQNMRALGNLLRHRYDTVQIRVIWQVIENDFLSLRHDCLRTIARLEGDNSA